MLSVPATEGTPQAKPVPMRLPGQSAGAPPSQKNEESAAGTQPDCSLNQSFVHRYVSPFALL
jgi:hypothetical protein